MRAWIGCLLALGMSAEGLAAKKDYKGLFGSYRQERFAENEARPTDYGIDLMLSTMFPVTSMVNSTEGADAGTPMSYAAFFNAEGSFFFTMSYHWELFLNLGYFSYETRKENATADPANPDLPLFHLFDFEAFPITLGVKYRFSTSDIVPYIGFGAGFAYVRRKGHFDYNTNLFNENFSNALTAQAMLGVQFYISARTGIRLEMSAMYLGVPSKVFDPIGNDAPTLIYQANPIAVRYSSGLFLLF